jgi:MFS family permease
MESKNNNQESPMMRVSLINPCVERNVRYLIFLVCCLCLSPFYYGYSMTYISTIDPDTFYKYFGQNAGKLQVIGYLIGTMPLGAAVGALTAPFLMNHLTRKYPLIYIGIFCCYLMHLLLLYVGFYR